MSPRKGPFSGRTEKNRYYVLVGAKWQETMEKEGGNGKKKEYLYSLGCALTMGALWERDFCWPKLLQLLQLYLGWCLVCPQATGLGVKHVPVTDLTL